MKNRIEQKFFELSKKQKKALACFITSGDPTEKIFEQILFSLPHHGADIIEVGLPFSDPMADGPTIQKSSQRAIKSGININKTLKIISKFRENDLQTPIILMGYFNPIFQYGLNNFFSHGKRAGIDGLIIVDLPPEEDYLIENFTEKFCIHNIRLITPTTNEERIKKISSVSKGFLYYVSVLGITGTKKPSIKEVKKSIMKIKRITNLPVLVGFGIDSNKQISQLNTFSDGCVVGSALIKIIESYSTNKVSKTTLLKKIKDFLKFLKKK